ncbi:MAG: choline-sulfatase [Opitutaceae bacterium]|nr:choline-sulfatase [Opitutaceae bacterium]
MPFPVRTDVLKLANSWISVQKVSMFTTQCFREWVSTLSWVHMIAIVYPWMEYVRKRILRGAVLVSCLGSSLEVCKAQDQPFRQAQGRPNVLFIAIDDMNDWVGSFEGHPQIITPHIDKLAEQGVLFSNAHCQAPICNPSRVSVFLGKLPSTTGMYFLGPNFRLVEGTKHEETLFQYFRKHGYFSSTMGKVFHGAADKASFDHIEKSRGLRRPENKLRYTVPGSHPSWDWGQVDIPDEETRDYKTAEWAVEVLHELAKKEQSFFLSIGFHLPHVPIYASKKWFDLYPLGGVQLPASRPDDRDDIPEIAKLLSLNHTAPRHEYMLESDEARHVVRAYLAANSFVDYLVGMVLQGLEESGEADNTIIVLWSDHGFHMGEKLRWSKRSIWEESTRVPLIISAPGMKEGERCSRPVGLIDLFPTLADLCGLEIRDDLEGQSLRPLLEDPKARWSKPALCTFGPNNHSLRSERWRYTKYADGSEELYNHSSDPNEWTNLAGDLKYKRIINRFQKFLPKVNAEPLLGSAGSDSPLYGEGHIPLQEAMQRGREQLNAN